MKLSFTLIFLSILLLSACKPKQKQHMVDKPRLVVGIVVDQMRPDYLSRYAEHFGEGGFKRLISQGFYNKNTEYNYIPTYTGPGHASIYTGTTPATHGIIANDWYDRALGKTVYCAGDSTMHSVGTTSDNGEMSPHRLLSTTITDELMLSTNFRSTVIGVSLKDRGSILPAGHTPTGAYWFDDQTGDFITSDYYFETLPAWLEEFNRKDLTQQYLDSTWSLSLEKDAYNASSEDNMEYEYILDTAKGATFPYNLKLIQQQFKSTGLIKSTPFGNTLLTDLAIAALSGESMGQDSITDFLALSYSSSDYIGHGFGPRSIELEDMYIKLDKQIERLLNFLDESVGKGNYTIFLTADHAAAEVPKYLQDHHIPAGYFNKRELKKRVENTLDEQFGAGDWVEHFSNEQFFFNHELIKSRKLTLEEIIDFVSQEVLKFEGIAEAYSAVNMRDFEYTTGMKSRLQKGYHFKRSGDLLLVLEPGWFAQTSSATTHGSGYKYDTHVPLLWYGAGIPKGESYTPQNITDIAPTLAFLLDTKLPNGAIGEPIEEIFKNK